MQAYCSSLERNSVILSIFAVHLHRITDITYIFSLFKRLGHLQTEWGHLDMTWIKNFPSVQRPLSVRKSQKDLWKVRIAPPLRPCGTRMTDWRSARAALISSSIFKGILHSRTASRENASTIAPTIIHNILGGFPAVAFRRIWVYMRLRYWSACGSAADPCYGEPSIITSRTRGSREPRAGRVNLSAVAATMKNFPEMSTRALILCSSGQGSGLSTSRQLSAIYVTPCLTNVLLNIRRFHIVQYEWGGRWVNFGRLKHGANVRFRSTCDKELYLGAASSRVCDKKPNNVGDSVFIIRFDQCIQYDENRWGSFDFRKGIENELLELTLQVRGQDCLIF